MQIETLKNFVNLVNEGSFYSAAKKSFISQQGLNKSISSLESELGVKLIMRSARGVRTTREGDIFLEYARTALESYDSMLSDLYAENQYSAPSMPPLLIHLTYYLAQLSRPILNSMDEIDSVSIAQEGFKQILDEVEESDGSELFLVDLYEGMHQKIASRKDLVFEPLLNSQLGLIWRSGSPLAKHRVIHRDTLADLPLAIDSHREMMHMMKAVMQDYPLNNVRLGVAEPRITLEYASKSNEVATTFDSFGFRLAQDNSQLETDELHFTPFSTPRSLSKIGFLHAKGAKPTVRARHAINQLKRHLQEQYSDYFERYPLA